MADPKNRDAAVNRRRRHARRFRRRRQGRRDRRPSIPVQSKGCTFRGVARAGLEQFALAAGDLDDVVEAARRSRPALGRAAVKVSPRRPGATNDYREAFRLDLRRRVLTRLLKAQVANRPNECSRSASGFALATARTPRFSLTPGPDTLAPESTDRREPRLQRASAARPGRRADPGNAHRGRDEGEEVVAD